MSDNENVNIIPASSDFCPRCGNREGIPLVFGYPSEKVREREANGEIFFGGISVGPGPWPNRQCRSCNYSWLCLDDDRPMPFDIADLKQRMPVEERDFYAFQWVSIKVEQAYRAIEDIIDSGYSFSDRSELDRINWFLDDYDVYDYLLEFMKLLNQIDPLSARRSEWSERPRPGFY